MSGQLITAIGNGASFLVSTISGKVGDNILEAFGDKVKLNKLENFTESLVKDNFQGENDDTINLVLTFIYINTTINLKYSFQRDLSYDEENRLWEDFVKYYKEESEREASSKFKSKIVYCVNQHNDKFKRLFLDDKTSFLAQLIQENNETNKNVMVSIAELKDIMITLDTKLSTQTNHIQKIHEALEYGNQKTQKWNITICILFILSSGLFSWLLSSISILAHSIIIVVSIMLGIFLVFCLAFIIYSFVKLIIKEWMLYKYNCIIANNELKLMGINDTKLLPLKEDQSK